MGRGFHSLRIGRVLLDLLLQLLRGWSCSSFVAFAQWLEASGSSFLYVGVFNVSDALGHLLFILGSCGWL